MNQLYVIKQVVIFSVFAVLSFSCQKAPEKRLKPIERQDKVTGSPSQAQSADNSKAQSSDQSFAQSSDTTTAKETPKSAPQTQSNEQMQTTTSTDATKADKAVTPTVTLGELAELFPDQGESKALSSPPVAQTVDTKTKAPAPTANFSGDVTSEDVRVEIKDVAGLQKLAADKSLVLHQGQVKKEDDIKEKLAQGDEDHYCKLIIKDSLKVGDKLKFEDSIAQILDEKLDVHQTNLIFKNSKSEIQFICTHTTSNFFIEDFYKNFVALLDFYGLNGALPKIKDFINPRTENRMVNAIRLLDTDKLEKVILDEKAAEGFGLSNGEVASIDLLSNKISAGVEKIACMVAEKVGTFDKSKVYIRVASGISSDTPKDIPSATMFTIYRADEKNYFILTCQMLKSSPWSDLMSAAKGVFQFGALSRIEYNKKFDEVMAIHSRLNP